MHVKKKQSGYQLLFNIKRQETQWIQRKRGCMKSKQKTGHNLNGCSAGCYQMPAF